VLQDGRPWEEEEDIAKARKLKELRVKEGKFSGHKATSPAKHVSFSRDGGPYPKKT